MKVLISDYSSNHTTEPLYLNTIFNTIGCESTIWPKNISTFDMFDMSMPNLHITHHSMLTKDLAIYLQNTKINIIVNITGISQQNLTSLDNIFSEYNIHPLFFFVNGYDSNLKSKTNIVSILHGADIFLGKIQQQYEIDYGIFVDNKNQMEPIGQTYHYITNSDNLTNDVDIYLPVFRLNNLYVNYKNIVIKYFNKILPQILFDASIYNGNVFFDIKDRSLLDDHLKKLLGEENKCNLNNDESGKIRDLILKKHTCLHRAKSLLSQLPDTKIYIDNLQNIIEKSII